MIFFSNPDQQSPTKQATGEFIIQQLTMKFVLAAVHAIVFAQKASVSKPAKKIPKVYFFTTAIWIFAKVAEFAPKNARSKLFQCILKKNNL